MQKIQHLCDVCHYNGENGGEQPAQHLAVQVGVDSNQMVVDLCESHKSTLDRMLDPYFGAGRRPDAVITAKPAKSKGKGGPKPTPAGDFHCPVNQCERTFTSGQGVSMHLTRVHLVPGIASHGQEAHDAAIKAASAQDVAPATSGNAAKIALPTRAGKTEDQRERERERDRARKARKRQELAKAN